MTCDLSVCLCVRVDLNILSVGVMVYVDQHCLATLCSVCFLDEYFSSHDFDCYLFTSVP